MVVVAGPPGSGKSTLYPVSSFGIASFNADDSAAELNWVYDNTLSDAEHALVLEVQNGELQFIKETPPSWLRDALEL